MSLLKSFKFSACHILHILLQTSNDIVFDRDYHIEITVMCLYAFKHYGNKHELSYSLN